MLAGRRRVVLLVALAAVATSLTCSLLQPERYAASADVLIPQPTDLVQFNPQAAVRQDLSREVQLQADRITSSAVRDQVKDLIGATPAVTATPQVGADVIVVAATAPTLAEARNVVDAYVQAYVEVRRNEAGLRLFAFLDQTLGQYQEVRDRLAARPIAEDGTLDAEQRALLLQQADLRERIDQAQVSGGARSAGVFSLGPARGPAEPVTPTPVLSTILAGLAGTLIGLAAVVVIEVLDDTISEPDDVGPRARRLPCVAEVPYSRQIGTVATDRLTGPAAEALRSVRTALSFVSLDGAPQVIQVTSSNPGEGKTTTAVNLAVSIAATGRRVCLVSGDLRRPRLEAELGLPTGDGFTSVVLGAVDLHDVLMTVPNHSRLSVLPAGPLPPNPAEVIESVAADAVFARLRDEFDTVVLDSAPVLPVTDGALLSERADLTLLVVAAGRTTRTDLDRALEILDQVAAPVGALVVNHPAPARSLSRPAVLGSRQVARAR